MDETPIALGIESLPASEAGQLSMEEHIYLKGRPPLKDFLHLMEGLMVNSQANGNAEDSRSLAEEWRQANEHIRTLEKKEAGCADHPVIGPLPPHLEPLLEELRKDPLFHHAFNFVPAEVGMVELDRMVVYQRHINLNFVRQLKARLGPQPGDEEVFRTALPFDHPQPPIRWMRTRSSTFVFTSPSNDLRFLDSVVLDSEQIAGYAPHGVISGVVGLVVGFGSNFLNTMQVGNRIILNNGSHRAFTLRDLGVTHAPCIIQHVSSNEEFRVMASSHLRRNPDLYLKHPRPPMFKDYFDPQLRKVVLVPRKVRQVRVKFEIDETDMPAL